MDKIVVYGLGQYFKKNFSEIFSKYHIVGLSDKNVNKAAEMVRCYSDELTHCEIVKPEDLKDKYANYDFILIVAGGYAELARYLIESFGIDPNKIRVYLPKPRGEVSFYGEHNEDAVIGLILSRFGIKPDEICYLDIGANSPITCNNSYSLYCQGASGCLVDPLGEFQYASMVTRRRDKFVRAAVSDVSQKQLVPFYVCDNSALSSLHDEHRKRWDGLTSNGLKRKLDVRIIGINDILKDMEKKPEIIFIDAEGEDIKIAKAIDYGQYLPLIICVEICGYPKNEVEGFVSFMREKGYILFSDIKGVNYIFLKEKMMEKKIWKV